jgi:hypothetical protein
MENKKKSFSDLSEFQQFTIVAFCVFLLIPIIEIASSWEQPSEFELEIREEQRKVDRAASEARQCVKDEVRANLKDPYSADFPFMGVEPVHLSGNSFAVTSYVESKNGFGLMVRTDFFCSVEVKNVQDGICETTCYLE